MDNQSNNIQSAINSGLAQAIPRQIPGHKPYAIIPEGATLHVLDEEDGIPPRVKASPVFHDAPSFIAYVKAFGPADSPRIFADVEASKVVAILDYHVPGTGDEGARYGDHRATYVPKESEEWKAWKALNGKQMGQEQLAEFFENNRVDFLTPDAATMLEVAGSLSVTKGVNFKSAKRMFDGQVNFAYVEEVNGTVGTKGEFSVPQTFTIGLRPYLGCEKRPIEARFRYRLNGAELKLWFDLFRPIEIQRDAFDGILKRIADETALAVALGVP